MSYDCFGRLYLEHGGTRLALIFRTTVHKSGGRFAIPKWVRTELKLGSNSVVELIIRSVEGQVLFTGSKQMKSGSEVYGADIPKSLTAGRKIVVEISAPDDAHEVEFGQRRFWVVSPNVMNDLGTVGEWRNASIKFGAAFMGWGPDEQNHKGIGAKFAHTIRSEDIVLIARRSNHQVEVVGFGVVKGTFKTSLDGFTAPEGPEWRGSLRLLRPFKARTQLPESLKVISALKHTTALRELIPNRRQSEKRLCEWLERELNQSVQVPSGKVARSDARPKTVLVELPNDEGLDYKVMTRAQSRVAQKKEAELAQQYERWLHSQGRTLHVAKHGKLRCDAFEVNRNNLIEAKSCGKREYIRMAVGQLLDYSHLMNEEVGSLGLAILLPSRPSKDVEYWLRTTLRIYVIWRDGNVFLDNANGRFI